MRTTLVRDVMTHEVVTVGPRTPVKDIIDLMARDGISAVPVVDARGTPVGVVSGADLLRRQEHQDDEDRATPSIFAGHSAREQWRKATGLTAADVMTSPVLTVAPGESLPSAARLLARAGVRRLFVADGALLVGVLARRDLLHAFLRSDDDIRADVDRDVFGSTLHADPSTVRATVEHGVVMLTGRLECRAELDTAVRAVRSIPGVVEVTNRLDYVWTA